MIHLKECLRQDETLGQDEALRLNPTNDPTLRCHIDILNLHDIQTDPPHSVVAVDLRNMRHSMDQQSTLLQCLEIHDFILVR